MPKNEFNRFNVNHSRYLNEKIMILINNETVQCMKQ